MSLNTQPAVTIAKILITTLLVACGTPSPDLPMCGHPESEGALIAPDKRWPDHHVVVCWENPTDGDGPDRALVEQTIDREITQRFPVQLLGWKSCAATSDPRPLRIRIADETPRTEGLGRDLAGLPHGMVLNLTFASWSPNCGVNPSTRINCIRSTAVHEFLHALGVEHEHERDDTPAVCAARVEKETGMSQLASSIPVGDWDRESATNYCNPVWNNGGRLSPGDVSALQRLYPDAAVAHSNHGSDGHSHGSVLSQPSTCRH